MAARGTEMASDTATRGGSGRERTGSGEGEEGADAGGKVPVSDLIYSVEDNAPWHITLFYIIQQVLTVVPSVTGLVVVQHSMICGGEDYTFLAQLTATAMFMLGVGTLLQVMLGVRLPMIQGSSFLFIPVISVMMSSDKYKCPTEIISNTTVSTIFDEPVWSPRIRALSGSLMVGAVVQVLLAFTGIFGLLIPYIGPLTVGPAMALLGLSLYPLVINTCDQSWPIAFLVAAIIVVFGAGLRNVKVPLPTYTKQEGCGCRQGHYLFRLLPQIAATLIGWLLCYILTLANVFTGDKDARGYLARTDAKVSALERASTFYFPLPGQWGPPSLDWGLVVSIIIASLMGMVESTGDYYVISKVCEKPSPPKHVFNRGLGMEGIINIICGALNMGHGTASHSGPIAYLKINGLASRLVFILLAIVLIILSVFGHVSAFLVMMPEPVIGGLNIATIGLIMMTGLSSLQYVDLNSSRNMMILAVSIMSGMALPFWVLNTPDAFNTGNTLGNEVLAGIFSSAMFVGALIGFTLDNILPGTVKERGLVAYKLSMGATSSTADDDDLTVYDLPLLTKARCGHLTCCTFIPFLPTHVERTWFKCDCCNQKNIYQEESVEKIKDVLGKENTGYTNPDHTKF